MGKVYLVGAGPGDPDLLTLKAARLLASADIVLHDALVSDAVLAMVSPRAQIINIGRRHGQKLLTQEEIGTLLAACAAQHEVVVRLKGGDPLIFGRAGEEMESLRRRRVEFEVVPGITAAIGAAAAAGISLTDRRQASQVLLTTFSRGKKSPEFDWNQVNADTTIAVYMPGQDYSQVATWLLDAGLAVDTPCAIVSQAASSRQTVKWTSVAELFDQKSLPAPSLLIVGRVAARPGARKPLSPWRAQSARPEPREQARREAPAVPTAAL